MVMHVMAMQLIRIVQAVRNVDDMKIAMGLVATQLGFQYFALTHHVDIVAANGRAIRIHDYPARWAEYYDGRADRQSVVEGKRVSVRVDLGGCRLIKKKKEKATPKQ